MQRVRTLRDLPPNTNIDELLNQQEVAINPKKLEAEMNKPFSSRVKIVIQYDELEKKYVLSPADRDKLVEHGIQLDEV
jgi:hypothetical protein